MLNVFLGAVLGGIITVVLEAALVWILIIKGRS